MTIYYVDKTTGADGDDGLSEADAWETADHVNDFTFSAGDIIKFKKGEVWREIIHLGTSKEIGEEGNVIEVTNYGEGDLPLFTGAVSIMSWTQVGATDVWYNDDATTDPHGVFLDDISYLEAADAVSVNATNRWYWDAGTPRLYIYATSDPNGFYSTIEVPANLRGMDLLNTHWIKWNGIHIRDATHSAVYLRGTTHDVEFVNCTIDRGSYATVFIESGPADLTFDNCTIDNGQVARYNNVVEANGCGAGIIKNCTISRGSHSGLILVNITTANGWTIENNEFYSAAGFGRNIDLQGDAGEGGHIFRYNYVHDSYAGAQSAGNDQMHGVSLQVYYNIFADAQDGNKGLDFWDEAGDVLTGLRLYNNIIYGADGVGLSISTTSSSGNDNIVKNNIIVGNDSTNNYQVYFQTSAMVADYAFTNNCIYHSGTSNTVYDEGDIRTVSWMDTNFATWSSNLVSDPNFIDAANDDFRLLMGSICRNAGTAVSLISDYLGIGIRHAPDIGAYEEQTNSLF